MSLVHKNNSVQRLELATHSHCQNRLIAPSISNPYLRLSWKGLFLCTWGRLLPHSHQSRRWSPETIALQEGGVTELQWNFKWQHRRVRCQKSLVIFLIIIFILPPNLITTLKYGISTISQPSHHLFLSSHFISSRHNVQTFSNKSSQLRTLGYLCLRLQPRAHKNERLE